MNLPFYHTNSTVTLGHSGIWPFYVLPVRLRGHELEKHKYIMGVTGQGKSKFNAHLATSLILQGQPCSVVDPHADLVHDILAILHDKGFFRRPGARQKLWYIEFARPDRCVPFNILRQPYPIQITVRNVLEACKRTWPSLAGGAAPQFENILQFSAVVLAQNNLPLTYATKLLTNQDYREGLLQHCTHKATVEFFHDRFDRWEARERAHNIESTLNKLSILTFSDPLLHAIGHSDNLLNFRRILDEGISVLFNLGNLDEETRHLFGSLIMVGFEQATLSRADMLEHDRRRYHLLIDEFPQFSTRNEESFTTFLSEARKFKVTLTLSHQTGMQISERFHSALQNALPIIFKLGREDALSSSQIFGHYNPYQVKHSVVDETHPVFFNVQEQFETMAGAIEELEPREAYIKLKRRWLRGSRTVKFRSITVAKTKATWEQIQALRDLYATLLLSPIEKTTDQPVAPAVAYAYSTPLRRRG